MTVSKILTVIYASFLIAEARHHNLLKRELSTLCNVRPNSTSNVQCYCLRDAKNENYIRSADCSLFTEGLKDTDKDWDAFSALENITKLTLTTNNRGISWNYIPSKIFSHLKKVLKIDVKYGHIEKLHPFAFSNCNTVQEISLTENQIHILEPHAIAHHKDLKVLNLDQNIIEEINRNVFVGLPSLESLFLTGNKITTLHDRAFLHLTNLVELEINMNSLFSLNSETFSGLKKLEKLDLSSNMLEVIGDNTFLPLTNLRTLNLEGNKIVMLDDKAFNGLKKLQTLSLAHNKINQIESTAVFDGLPALNSLSLRGNEMKNLKKDVIVPILGNFYQKTANFDVEDNNLMCNCQLDWFLILMTNTMSTNLKIAMENLKCLPDSKLKEAWSKIEESEKKVPAVDEVVPPNNDYEYYDESQLNGKLFYIDVRDLLNCTGPTSAFLPSKDEAIKKEKTDNFKPKSITEEQETTAKINGYGTLDLSETTPEDVQTTIRESHEGYDERKQEKVFTTNRITTVSENPIDTKLYENMASDEAKPDKLNMQRNIDEDIKRMHITKDSLENTAYRSLSSGLFIAAICFRLLY